MNKLISITSALSPKFLLIKPGDSSFIREDEKILASIGSLHSVNLHQNEGRIKYLISLLYTIFWLIKTDKDTHVVVWFADYHAALASLICKLRKLEITIFVGGYDTICYKELGMGVFCRFLRRLSAVYAMKNCNRIIANHQSLIYSSNQYYCKDGHFDGIKHYIKDLCTPYYVIHNSLSSTGLPNLDIQRKKQVLCVGTTPRYMDFYNKGYDVLIEACRMLPEILFVFVGIQEKWMSKLNTRFKLNSIPNLIIYHHVPQPQLHKLMEESKVYAQFSISEGMPNALMEAMYYGCVPIGSNVAGIPTVIDNHGIIVRKKDPMLILQAITEALQVEPDRKIISKSIQDRFAPSIRNKKIKALFID